VPTRGLTAQGEPSGLVVPMRMAGLSDLDLTLPEVSFDTVQHLVSAAAGEVELDDATTPSGRRGFRDRLARMLDGIQGPPPTRDW
jgi:hypothetical protein